MLMSAPKVNPVTFPHPEPPKPGTIVTLAPDLLWARFPLPFQLNHVNIYLVRGDRGWVALDTAISTPDCHAAWDALLEGPLRDGLEAIVVSHFHPDHSGLSGWLTRRFDIPMHMPRTEYLFCAAIQHGALNQSASFYTRHGMDQDLFQRVTGQGQGYLRLTSGLPPSFRRLRDGGTLMIGGRRFDVLTGGGHAPEQAMLHCAEEGWFFSADQVLTRISPNISTESVEPEADPLGEFLVSLDRLEHVIPADVLVLPGHHVPFRGLHTRTSELIAHHAGRCALIEAACRIRPHSAAELVPVVFQRALDPQQLSFAFHEVVAHVNYMRAQRTLTQFAGPDGTLLNRWADL